MEIDDLIKKYHNKVTELEEELVEAKRKLNSLLEVSELLRKEGASTNQENLFQSPPQFKVSNKYENLSMSKAIIDFLKDSHSEPTAREILTGLTRNGFKSDSKSLLQDIYGQLKNLQTKGDIISIKKKKSFMRYKIVSQEKTP